MSGELRPAGEMAAATFGTQIVQDSRPRHTTNLTITPSGGYILTETRSSRTAIVTQRLESQGKASSSTMLDLRGVYKREQGVSPKEFEGLVKQVMNQGPMTDPATIAARRTMTKSVENMMASWCINKTRGPVIRSPNLGVAILGVLTAGAAAYYISTMKKERSDL